MQSKETIDLIDAPRTYPFSMSTMKISDSDGIAVVTLSRPPVNAMDSTSLEELTATFERLAGDAAVKAAVLTGEGNAFSAGLDLKSMPTLDLAGQHRLIAALNDSFGTLYAWPKPLVAAVNGHAMAGGLVAALCADWRIAADLPLKASLAEVRVGVTLPVAAMQVAIGELSPPAARRMVLLSEVVDVAGALSLGVFDESAPAASLLRQAIDRARGFAGLPPQAFATTKRELRAAALARIADARAGIERRYADWIGEETKAAAQAALRPASRP
ncbi:MAG: enoyl-CoA hydratase/isomerase family protein [Alphaproteobacteria bacterium]|nr:enoyl-CoA hydratase/isomerase family protein [Alphaproteobacteria bacterium]